jgi:hypothetical protein
MDKDHTFAVLREFACGGAHAGTSLEQFAKEESGTFLLLLARCQRLEAEARYEQLRLQPEWVRNL